MVHDRLAFSGEMIYKGIFSCSQPTGIFQGSDLYETNVGGRSNYKTQSSAVLITGSAYRLSSSITAGGSGKKVKTLEENRIRLSITRRSEFFIVSDSFFYFYFYFFTVAYIRLASAAANPL